MHEGFVMAWVMVALLFAVLSYEVGHSVGKVLGKREATQEARTAFFPPLLTTGEAEGPRAEGRGLAGATPPVTGLLRPAGAGRPSRDLIDEILRLKSSLAEQKCWGERMLQRAMDAEAAFAKEQNRARLLAEKVGKIKEALDG